MSVRIVKHTRYQVANRYTRLPFQASGYVTEIRAKTTVEYQLVINGHISPEKSKGGVLVIRDLKNIGGEFLWKLELGGHVYLSRAQARSSLNFSMVDTAEFQFPGTVEQVEYEYDVLRPFNEETKTFIFD